ncbi:E3 ubiquitin-protein ligase [Mizuhopecten yessoensis]|uniref:E3 ubiquitin-protein ligase n=1 Tax=Mizuhopecten yessoensis TaxID=6573 RepID=A0A210QMJ8_MIZYE|nr:E3 ubiquitin-protein ligase [Mizuhopecten yessoensis]
MSTFEFFRKHHFDRGNWEQYHIFANFLFPVPDTCASTVKHNMFCYFRIYFTAPDNLYGYCWSQLTEQTSSFRCFADVNSRRCDWEWFFPEVAENACLSKDERILFESRINRNWVNLSAGVRECPFCRCVCERQKPDDPHVLCVYCQNAGEPNCHFCWYCLYPWKDHHSCTKDSARQILSTCPRKEIVKVTGCPSIRACPGCKILIEHKDQCKHMDCRNCKTSFCFICLEVRGQRGFSCGSYNTKCAVATIQTVT